MRDVRIPPIAGIPLLHRVHGAIDMELGGGVDWPGTPATDAPVTIDHVIGEIRTPGMHATIDVPPWCTYLAASDGDVAIRFHHVNRGDVVRVVRTVEPGRRYVVHYATVPPEPVMPLQPELAVFSLALTSRGRGMIAHSCGFTRPDGGAVLCPGVSGTGKTTLASLLAELPDAPEVLSDDRTVVTHGTDGLRLWGTPWPGAARLASPGGAPLDAVVFIRHGERRALRTLDRRDGFRRILNALAMPLWDATACGPALDVVDAIVSRTRLVEATYPKTAAAAEWLVDALSQNAHVDA